MPLWRAVEAQHVVATRVLVDNLAEHEVLEALLEEAKPPVARAAARLDYLLFTPFRYPPLEHGSRFRGLTDPGVWYGAEEIRTSCAELGYWRWRFVTASHGLARLDAVAHTVFQALARGATIDLRLEPFVRDCALWTDVANYAACQALARAARQGGVTLVRYQSVRDPQRGGCGAVLDPGAFTGEGAVHHRQTWFLSVDRQRACWVRGTAPAPRAGETRAGEAYEFVYGVSAPD